MADVHPIIPASRAVANGINGGTPPAKPPTQEERTMQEYIKRNGTKDGPPSEFGFGARRIANFLGLYGN
jgi:hypothetical protein